jgi:hypothetical protein
MDKIDLSRCGISLWHWICFARRAWGGGRKHAEVIAPIAPLKDADLIVVVPADLSAAPPLAFSGETICLPPAMPGAGKSIMPLRSGGKGGDQCPRISISFSLNTGIVSI